jgi:cell division protein FtsZ
MTIQLTAPELTELKPKITVIGVGGAGGNAVNNMITADLKGVEFVAANTDAQALSHSSAGHIIQLGGKTTQGLGAGSRPEVGRAAAEENIDVLEEALAGSHMAFITAGMGGGTGTGGAPVVAKLAKSLGILTVGVVTKPFKFEGSRRMKIAEEGIIELQKEVDTLIIIPNQNLFRIANDKTTFADAFGMADEVLQSGVRGITDLMTMPGLINLDFADVNTVMNGMGKAMMGTGEAEGENRAIKAAEAAISNPLLDEESMQGAKGVIINITGGDDLTLFEVDEAATHISNQVDCDANIIIGSATMQELTGRIRVSVVATGVGESADVRSSDHKDMKAEDVLTLVSSKIVQEEHLEQVELAPSGEQVELEDIHVYDEQSSFIVNDQFMADAPAEPATEAEYEGLADPFAEAAMANAMTSAAEAEAVPMALRPTAKLRDEPKKTRGLSLFERIMGSDEKEESIANDASFAHDTNVIDENYRSGLGGLTTEDRPAPEEKDDQLDIPSFLKRKVF